ncbi:MAG TPA: ABC transporter substrate-binding protein [Dongiaceae bacterium]|nr:ABC transporter substrate-binding protein [Dongiaceae bacterium]
MTLLCRRRRNSAGRKPDDHAPCQSPAAPCLSSRLRVPPPICHVLRRGRHGLISKPGTRVIGLALALLGALPCDVAVAGNAGGTISGNPASGNTGAGNPAAGNPAAGDAAPRHLTVALPEGLDPRTIGFYLAEDQGYFRNNGLAVDFITDPAQSPSRLLADGKADLAVDLMPVALQLHQGGIALQHVAQFFQHSSLGLYCRPPIAKPADLHGTTIGVWFGGEESSFYAWMSQLNISTFGEEDGVTVLRQSRVSQALGDARLDCVTSTSYLAPRQMRAGGIAPNSRMVFRYEELGVGTLEDGLYARTKDLSDKDRLDLLARFLAASIRGWQKLHDDRGAALRLLRANTPGDAAPAGATATAKGTGNPDAGDLATLKTSLDAVDGLVDAAHYKIGLLDADTYDRTVNLLLTGAPDPVLQGAPVAAVSDVVWKHLRQVTGQAKP